MARPHTASSPVKADNRQQKLRPGRSLSNSMHLLFTSSTWGLKAVSTPCSCTGALPGRVPGGERAIAARVKQEGRNAKISLGNHEGFYVPSWPATPRDLSEKESYSCVLSASCTASQLLHSTRLLPPNSMLLPWLPTLLNPNRDKSDLSTCSDAPLPYVSVSHFPQFLFHFL
jgi:hypothetical protein